MEREEIIRMAREAGAPDWWSGASDSNCPGARWLPAFAELVIADFLQRTGQWVDVPKHLVEMLAGLNAGASVQILHRRERDGQTVILSMERGDLWGQDPRLTKEFRPVAYKVVKP